MVSSRQSLLNLIPIKQTHVYCPSSPTNSAMQRTAMTWKGCETRMAAARPAVSREVFCKNLCVRSFMVRFSMSTSSPSRSCSRKEDVTLEEKGKTDYIILRSKSGNLLWVRSHNSKDSIWKINHWASNKIWYSTILLIHSNQLCIQTSWVNG